MHKTSGLRGSRPLVRKTWGIDYFKPCREGEVPLIAPFRFYNLLLSHANSNGLHPPGSSRLRCYRETVTHSNDGTDVRKTK
jgi:hypothetical protein